MTESYNKKYALVSNPRFYGSMKLDTTTFMQKNSYKAPH